MTSYDEEGCLMVAWAAIDRSSDRLAAGLVEVVRLGHARRQIVVHRDLLHKRLVVYWMLETFPESLGSGCWAFPTTLASVQSDEDAGA
jgi:hypothetical protein